MDTKRTMRRLLILVLLGFLVACDPPTLEPPKGEDSVEEDLTREEIEVDSLE